MIKGDFKGKYCLSVGKLYLLIDFDWHDAEYICNLVVSSEW